MRILILSLIACFALVACTPRDIDTAVKQNLPTICSATEQLHAAFLAVSLSGAIKPKLIAKEAAAWDGVKVVCADPANATAIGTLARVSAAYAIITQAMREAKG